MLKQLGFSIAVLLAGVLILGACDSGKGIHGKFLAIGPQPSPFVSYTPGYITPQVQLQNPANLAQAYASYTYFLSHYVTDQGQICYSAANDPFNGLEAFLVYLTNCPNCADVAQKNPDAALGLYVNAYNAFAVEATLDAVRAGAISTLDVCGPTQFLEKPEVNNTGACTSGTCPKQQALVAVLSQGYPLKGFDDDQHATFTELRQRIETPANAAGVFALVLGVDSPYLAQPYAAYSPRLIHRPYGFDPNSGQLVSVADDLQQTRDAFLRSHVNYIQRQLDDSRSVLVPPVITRYVQLAQTAAASQNGEQLTASALNARIGTSVAGMFHDLKDLQSPFQLSVDNSNAALPKFTLDPVPVRSAASLSALREITKVEEIHPGQLLKLQGYKEPFLVTQSGANVALFSNTYTFTTAQINARDDFWPPLVVNEVQQFWIASQPTAGAIAPAAATASTMDIAVHLGVHPVAVQFNDAPGREDLPPVSHYLPTLLKRFGNRVAFVEINTVTPNLPLLAGFSADPKFKGLFSDTDCRQQSWLAVFELQGSTLTYVDGICADSLGQSEYYSRIADLLAH